MNNKGFTLIEVIIVLALISIISLIAITKIDTDYGYINSFSKELLYDIRYVRDETMRGKPEYSIELGGNEASGYFYKIYLGTNVEKEVKLKDKFRINYSPTSAIIKYKADGILMQGAQSIILEKKDLSEKIEIIVNELGNTYTR